MADGATPRKTTATHPPASTCGAARTSAPDQGIAKSVAGPHRVDGDLEPGATVEQWLVRRVVDALDGGSGEDDQGGRAESDPAVADRDDGGGDQQARGAGGNHALAGVQEQLVRRHACQAAEADQRQIPVRRASYADERGDDRQGERGHEEAGHREPGSSAAAAATAHRPSASSSTNSPRPPRGPRSAGSA